MSEIVQSARKRNNKSWPSSKCVWSADHEINSCESLRIELRQQSERAVVDIRRWRKLPDGTPSSTEKGYAISVRHMRALKDLIETAIARAEADGLLDERGAS
jgi:hypothetical protein